MIDQLWEYFKIGLMVAGVFPLIIGTLVCFSFALPIKLPADQSNRFNRMRLVWYAVSAPHRFVHAFWWMSGDESDNLQDREWRRMIEEMRASQRERAQAGGDRRAAGSGRGDKYIN